MVGVLSCTMKAFNGLRICIEAHRNSIFHRLCALHLPLTSHLILIDYCDCISNEHSPSCEKTVFLSPNSRHNRISTWTFVSMTFPLILHFPPTPWKIHLWGVFHLQWVSWFASLPNHCTFLKISDFLCSNLPKMRWFHSFSFAFSCCKFLAKMKSGLP